MEKACYDGPDSLPANRQGEAFFLSCPALLVPMSALAESRSSAIHRLGVFLVQICQQEVLVRADPPRDRLTD